MGLNFNEALEKHDISIKELSGITGINKVSLYNFKDGKTKPRESTYLKLKFWEMDLDMEYIPSRTHVNPHYSNVILKHYNNDEWAEGTLPGYIFYFKETPECIPKKILELSEKLKSKKHPDDVNLSSVHVSIDSIYAYLKGEKMFTKEEKDNLYILGVDDFPKIIFDKEAGLYIAEEKEMFISEKIKERSRIMKQISLSGGKIYGVNNRHMGWLCGRLVKMGFLYSKWIHPKYGSWVIKYWRSVKWKLQMRPEQEWVFKEKLVDSIDTAPKLINGDHSNIAG